MSSTTVSAVPKYRHHKGTGQAFVQIKGRRHYLGKWDTPESKEALRRFRCRTCRPGPPPLPPLPPVPTAQITVTELCRCLLGLCPGLLPQEREPQRLAGPYPPDASKAPRDLRADPRRRLRPAQGFKAIRQTLIDAGHSRPYINKLVPIIPRMFKWAAAEEIVPGAVYHALRTVEGLRKGARTPTRPSPCCPSPTRWSRPRCPTCPRWWPIWSASSG